MMESNTGEHHYRIYIKSFEVCAIIEFKITLSDVI